MRSYASIFSRASFANLLATGNIDFLNKKISKFDSNLIEKKFSTYFEYISYVYRVLKKEYRCEYVYKNEIINELLLKKYGTKNTVVINEFQVGNSVADMVLFNGTSKAFEIKTELDSEKRLFGQLNDYTKVFKECYIVTHESLVNKYLLQDEQIGIISLSRKGKSIKLEEIRKANKTNTIDSNNIIRCLRTQEYKNIIKSYYGCLPSVNSFEMFNACADMMKDIPVEELNLLFISELKKRVSNTEFLSSFHKELRQLCLSLKIKQSDYQFLVTKLNQQIKLT